VGDALEDWRAHGVGGLSARTVALYRGTIVKALNEELGGVRLMIPTRWLHTSTTGRRLTLRTYMSRAACSRVSSADYLGQQAELRDHADDLARLVEYRERADPCLRRAAAIAVNGVSRSTEITLVVIASLTKMLIRLLLPLLLRGSGLP
jgi:hypothetical protein